MAAAAISAGSGYAVGNSVQGYGVYISSASVKQGGNIVINGEGYNGTTNNNYGIFVSGGNVSTSGTGTITLYGIGQGTGNSTSDSGIVLVSGGIGFNGQRQPHRHRKRLRQP